MKVQHILETCLYVDDLERAENFYRDVLGLELFAKQEDRHIFFRCGETMFLLFNPETTLQAGTGMSPHGAKGPGHAAFVMEAGEADRWREWLTHQGVAIESEVNWPNGGYSIYFRDPTGNVLELATRAVWSGDV